MKYTELLDRFWAMDRDFSKNEVFLYLYLLHRCNALDWPDTFTISNEELLGVMKCRPTIMKEARKSLIDAGLITYDAGNGRGKSSFFSIVVERGNIGNPFSKKGVHLEPLYEEKRGNIGNPFTDISTSKSSDVNSVSDKKGVHREPLYEENKEKTKNKEKTPPAPPIKKEKNKKETAHPLTTGAHTHTCENGQTEIVFNELKEKPLKKKRELVEPILPESMDEVVSFFEKKAASKLPKWKEEAEIFFYHFESIGWAGTYGRKIHDWKAKANLWICDRVLELQKQKSNQNGTTINNTSNERAASDIEAAELVERLLRENELESEGVPGAVQP